MKKGDRNRKNAAVPLPSVGERPSPSYIHDPLAHPLWIVACSGHSYQNSTRLLLTYTNFYQDYGESE